MGLEVTFSPLKTRTRIPGIRRHRSARREGPQGESGCAALLARPAASGTPAPDTAAEPSCAAPSRPGALPTQGYAPYEHCQGPTAARRAAEEDKPECAEERFGPGTAVGQPGGGGRPPSPRPPSPPSPGAHRSALPLRRRLEEAASTPASCTEGAVVALLLSSLASVA